MIVEFPLPKWSFTAMFEPPGQRCGGGQEVALVEEAEGRFRLDPAGYAGTYDVTLFGRGDGDLVVTFRWTTPHDGPRPAPQARLAVLANHDGEVDSYGVELEVENLPDTPQSADATITVEASAGESLTFDAVPAGETCLPEGTLYWDGPDDRGLAAAAIGAPPFTYQVELVLDGETYTATAHWPDDQIPDYEPSVSLDFEPALPALP